MAKVELGGESYRRQSRSSTASRHPVWGLNWPPARTRWIPPTLFALNWRRWSRSSRQGLKIVYPYDTTPFVKISIHEVVKTLVEAIILVFLVMYLFLQNFRATLIPTIAVPVVLLGTFAVLAAFGFSINTLTMFGMVLAIGLLVDDAIVVVENVERVMAEEGSAAERSDA